MRLKLLLIALNALFFVMTTAWSEELPDDVAKLSQWLASQSKSDQVMRAWRRDFIPPPQVKFADKIVLEKLASDQTKLSAERMAALAQLGVDDNERSKAIRKFFKKIRAQIRPYHVHPVEWYMLALQPEKQKNSPDNPMSRFSFKIAEKTLPFGAFVPADLQFLVHMALIENDGMAMAALGLLNDERAVEILLKAPFLSLGDRGLCNANYQGLRLLCNAPKTRRWLSSKIKKRELSAPRQAMIVLALAERRDPVALNPLANLVRALTKPADFAGSLNDWRSAPRKQILPYGIRATDVLNICSSWGAPALGDALAEYIYSGSGRLDEAFTAAKACGVKLSKPKLLALAATPQYYWDANAVLKELTPILASKDAATVAGLLAPTEWSKESFYTRVLWISEVPKTILTPKVRDAMIVVAVKEKNIAIREWALKALGRFNDSQSKHVLRQAENNGSMAAMRALCEDDPNPGSAFLRRFANSNPAVRKAAYDLIRAQSNGHEQVPGGLTPKRKAIILTHLLAKWPAADKSSECVENAVICLYILVVQSSLSEPAKRSPELAASVVRCADQVLNGKNWQQYATRLLVALQWAHTKEARKSLEKLAKSKDPHFETEAKKILHDWESSKESFPEK